VDWYRPTTHRALSADGTVLSNICVINLILSMALDGFDAWRQTGCKGKPAVIAVQILPADMRYKVACLRLVFVKRGSNELVKVYLVLEPLLAELNYLADGVDGVDIFEEEGALTLKAVVIIITLDVTTVEKVTHTTGHRGRTPGRLQFLYGFVSDRPYDFPPTDPGTCSVLFSVSSTQLSTGSRESITEASVEFMPADGRPATHVARQVRNSRV